LGAINYSQAAKQQIDEMLGKLRELKQSAPEKMKAANFERSCRREDRIRP